MEELALSHLNAMAKVMPDVRQTNQHTVLAQSEKERLTKESIDGRECQPFGKVFLRSRHQTELIDRRYTANEDDAVIIRLQS